MLLFIPRQIKKPSAGRNALAPGLVGVEVKTITNTVIHCAPMACANRLSTGRRVCSATKPLDCKRDLIETMASIEAQHLAPITESDTATWRVYEDPDDSDERGRRSSSVIPEKQLDGSKKSEQNLRTGS